MIMILIMAVMVTITIVAITMMITIVMTIKNDGLFPSDDDASLLGCYLMFSLREVYEVACANALLKPELHDEDNDDGDNEDDYNDYN